jgi:ribosomal protein S18 acetylase RimI-like enzyme
MAASTSSEILDLRHFAGGMLRPVLEAEGALWNQRLHWDYRASARLLMQYLDNHMLPGYAAVANDLVTGYVFCIYEETKAVIGDVFAMADQPANGTSTHELEETLLRHLLELLVNSPQVERIESQLLVHPSGLHAAVFREAGCKLYRRLFMMHPLKDLWTPPQVDLPSELELRPWRDEDLAPAARLISEAYRNHPDSLINDQYRSVHGSMRFLNNIVRYAGCGTFSAPTSHVVVHRTNREFVGLILGSRVSAESGHITQVCVHPHFRRHGMARMLLAKAAFHFMRQGATEISLTVTEANESAVDLYLAEGYTCKHKFDAAVWQRDQVA